MSQVQVIDQIMNKFTTSYHFFFKNLITGEEFETGTKKKYPICSCFKLAVLVAYFERIKQQSDFEEELLVDLNNTSVGGGVLNYLSGNVKLSYFHLAQLMIAFSDGTATDILYDSLTQETVNKVLKSLTVESDISSNLNSMVSNYSNKFQTLTESGVNKFDANQIIYNEVTQLQDFTNGRDLASLVYGTYSAGIKHQFREQFEKIFFNKRLVPRSAMFLPSSIKFIGKTGSLGYGHFMNDCAVIFVHDKLVGYFGYTSMGWTHTKDLSEVVLGFVGLEIAKFLDLSIQGNQNFSDQTKKILNV